jgi:hypothetical protein
MPNKKDIQVFDQSELDSLMAAIQQEDPDSKTEETSTEGGGSAPGEGEASKNDEAEETIEASADSSAGTTETVESEESQDQAPVRVDLDTLVENLQQDIEDHETTPGSPAAQDHPVAISQEDAPSANEGEDRDGSSPPDATTNDDVAGGEVKTVDQAELEALIKELQEGVARPTSETLSEISSPAPKANEQAQAPVPPPETEGNDGAAAAFTRKDKGAAQPELSTPPEQAEPIRKKRAVTEEQGVDAEPPPSKKAENKEKPVPAAMEQVAADSRKDTRSRQNPENGDTPDQTPRTEAEPSGEETVEAPEVRRSPGKSVARRKYAIGMVVVIIALAVAVGVWFVNFRAQPPGSFQAPKVQPEPVAQTPAPPARRASPVAAGEAELSPTQRVARIEAKLQEAEALRESLLIKRDEIAGLKKHYQDGIQDMQQVVLEEQNKNEIKSYPRGIKNSRIELGLQTIQRRMAYIDQLNKPLMWLNHASEELLFTNRQVTLELRLLDTVSGIDLEQLENQVVVAIQNFQPTVGHLAISPGDSEMPSLKSIWDGIVTTNQKRFEQVTSAHLPTDDRNQKIWQEICAGNYQRKAELSALSPDAAKCLAQSGESDLFLNGLTSLTPEAAKYLFQWQGNWVCLNGLTQISSETARYLFAWNGNWLSLNGLKEVRAEAARFLVQWPGRQLELMGLELKGQPFETNTLKYLAQWKQSGGKLYVPDDVEKQIVKLMK